MRVLHKFTIEEISAVDRPAQEHARALLLKRHNPAPAAFDSLDDAVAHLSKIHGRMGGLRKARELYRDLLTKFQAEGEAMAKSAASQPLAKADAALAFDRIVEATRSDNPRLSRTDALVKARDSNPAAFLAAYGT